MARAGSRRGAATATFTAGSTAGADRRGDVDNATATASITIGAANAAPIAAVTNGQCSPTKNASGMINLTLNDPDGDSLTLTFLSNSNPTRLTDGSVVLGGSGYNRTLTVTAAAKKSGSATLTVNLSDGQVTVLFVIEVRGGAAANETLNGTSGIDMIFGPDWRRVDDSLLITAEHRGREVLPQAGLRASTGNEPRTPSPSCRAPVVRQ